MLVNPIPVLYKYSERAFGHDFGENRIRRPSVSSA